MHSRSASINNGSISLRRVNTHNCQFSTKESLKPNSDLELVIFDPVSIIRKFSKVNFVFELHSACAMLCFTRKKFKAFLSYSKLLHFCGFEYKKILNVRDLQLKLVHFGVFFYETHSS